MKPLVHGEVARIGAALGSAKRLELLDALGQRPQSVEELAAAVQIDIRLASAHLRSLREARLVIGERAGRHVVYRLAGDDIATLLVMLRSVAERHLAELREAAATLAGAADEHTPLPRKALLAAVRSGEVLLLDVRPRAEFDAAHLPGARSVPIGELEARLAELPREVEIVAYCRGPYCVYARDAVALLRRHGFRATKTLDGVREWQAAGLPLQRMKAA